MSMRFPEHVAAVAARQQECSSRHEDDTAELLAHAEELRTGLEHALTSDVQPEDLVISGPAIREYHTSSWYVGALPEATAQLEYWASDGQATVRVAKERSWDVNSPEIGLLDRHVRNVGRWIPNLRELRKNRIALAVAQQNTLQLHEVPAVGDPDDDTMILLRSASRHKRDRKKAGIDMTSTLVGDETIGPIDMGSVEGKAQWLAHSRHAWDYINQELAAARPDSIDAAELAIESFKVQAAAKPTEEEVEQYRQHKFHEALNERAIVHSALVRVTQVVQDGRRIRPGVPQHSV